MLRATGWPAPLRVILVVPVTLFWAATVAALLEVLIPTRRLGPATLAGLGAAALAAAAALVLS